MGVVLSSSFCFANREKNPDASVFGYSYLKSVWVYGIFGFVPANVAIGGNIRIREEMERRNFLFTL